MRPSRRRADREQLSGRHQHAPGEANIDTEKRFALNVFTEKQMTNEPLRAELFREAVAVAVREATRDGKDASRLQVSRIDAIIEELKNAGIPSPKR